MPIWYQEFSVREIQERGLGTMAENIGITITAIGEDYLEGTMPVDYRTIQPLGSLHGGASVALAETLGSMAANYVVDRSKYYCVGLEINANHIRSARIGKVTGRAKPLHLGQTTHVWSIEITDEEKRLVCISRLTMAVLKK